VFFADETSNRPTALYDERVGSRGWMAPWADIPERLEKVSPTFDVFGLGKLLWYLISGKPYLHYWYFDRPEYDLEVLFPNEPKMRLVNKILAQSVVENEDACLSSATKLLLVVDESIQILQRGGGPLDLDLKRPCQVCGRGHYETDAAVGSLSFSGRPVTIRVFICDVCGHTQMFRTRNASPTGLPLTAT
jgi:serine/threonine protein kinase